MSELKFTGVVGREQIISIWPDVAPIILRAISAYNEHSLDEIFSSLLSSTRQLWVFHGKEIEAILITQIKTNNSIKVCHLELCAGRNFENLTFLKIVEEWAKSAGCTQMIISGRKGWNRKLKDYQIKKLILEKDL